MEIEEIRAICEAVRKEEKPMALTARFNPVDQPILEKYLKQETMINGVKYFLEQELVETDLFPRVNLDFLWVYIVYKNEKVREKYNQLKWDIEEARRYGELNIPRVRQKFAVHFGKMLGYSTTSLNEKYGY